MSGPIARRFARLTLVVGVIGVTGFVGAAGVLWGTALSAQQAPDVEFPLPPGEPAYATGQGPHVVVDGGHGNLHTVDGTYRPFARLLRRDGYRVDGLTEPFSDASLRGVDVLVIANALKERPASPGERAPSAFTDAEIDAVERWVRAGGALILIADHTPWAGAASALAGRFGVEYSDAFTYDGPNGQHETVFAFSKANGRLAEHATTRGVASVMTFLGSALRVTGEHVPLLRLSHTAVGRPTMGNAPSDDEVSLDGWLQGALVEAGEGRVGAFSEAAMFSAQARARGLLMGMNAPGAEDNGRFVLNLLHWLTDPR